MSGAHVCSISRIWLKTPVRSPLTERASQFILLLVENFATGLRNAEDAVVLEGYEASINARVRLVRADREQLAGLRGRARIIGFAVLRHQALHVQPTDERT